jgi:hypothetical protein
VLPSSTLTATKTATQKTKKKSYLFIREEGKKVDKMETKIHSSSLRETLASEKRDVRNIIITFFFFFFCCPVVVVPAAEKRDSFYDDDSSSSRREE